MKAPIISLAFLISLLVGCSSSPTKSLLEERAGYNVTAPPLGINGSGGVSYVPTRVPERVVVPWLFPHEMPSKVYFWGSWLSVVVEDERWDMVKVDVPKTDKRTMKTQDRPTKKPPKRAKTVVKLPAA